MIKLLYGTGNPAKLNSMKRALAGLELELVGLHDLGCTLPEVEETGNTPIENARIKASAYFRALNRPVFSCDSGLYFDNLPDELQPGVHVRNINGKRLSDEEMTAYYGGLAQRFGDLKGRYHNAICLILGEGMQFESAAVDLSGGEFILTGTPHKKRVAGYPLDCLSIDIKTGKYYYDLDAYQVDNIAQTQGFFRFFQNALRQVGVIGGK